jgi:6-phosphogluconolactonase
MGEYELKRFADAPSLARGVAGDWLELVRNCPNKYPFCVAVPGGRIAPLLFAAFATRVKTEGVDLESVHFFWGDERCVPPSNPESNFRVAWEQLLGPLQIVERQIHRIRGELAPGAAAEQAEADLRAVCATMAPNTPSFHLVLLGMGEDGHVASLFPGEGDALVSDPLVYRAVTASKPPPYRITLGYPVIAAARSVWVLVSGAGKEAALRQSLERGGTPLGRVLSLRQDTRIYSDSP